MPAHELARVRVTGQAAQLRQALRQHLTAVAVLPHACKEGGHESFCLARLDFTAPIVIVVVVVVTAVLVMLWPLCITAAGHGTARRVIAAIALFALDVAFLTLLAATALAATALAALALAAVAV